MKLSSCMFTRRLFATTILGICVCGASAMAAAPAYHPINPTMENRTVTLTGHNLTIEEIVAVARYGAKVQYGPGVVEAASDARELKLEAGAENIPVYGLNRGAGALREVTKKESEPETSVPPWLNGGVLPEVMDEEIVRAAMLISANTAVYASGVPEALQMMLDVLNKRLTPVAYARGTLGEADFPAVADDIQSMLGGHGEAYLKGVRMPSAQALKQAGLKGKETGLGGGGGAENAYGDALAALLVADGQAALEWADLLNAMTKLGMNSSLTPMVTPNQAKRPFKWVNWDAARTLDILKGSYLFDGDQRILQDPESMRASYIRQGSAWQAWARLRDNVLLQVNSADLNPMAIVGASPEDSWELSTPQFMKYYVKGGPLSHGKHGYVFSTANWDPYPMVNEIESFTNALANADAAIAQRIERFTDRGPTAFFTGIKPKDVLNQHQINQSPALSEPYFVFMDLWAEIQNLSRGVTPEGNAADEGVADIEAFTRIKATRGREVVDLTMQLMAYDLLASTYWMDVRKAENAKREFGQAPTAVWAEFRKGVPWQMDVMKRPEIPYGVVAYNFLKAMPASHFYPGGPGMPDADDPQNHSFKGGAGR